MSRHFKIVLSTQYKRDLKRYQNRPGKIKSLKVVLNHLMESGIVPSAYFPHKLRGTYEGCMECHVGTDFLLIWMDEAEKTVKLLRLGTHHEIFGL